MIATTLSENLSRIEKRVTFQNVLLIDLIGKMQGLLSFAEADAMDSATVEHGKMDSYFNHASEMENNIKDALRLLCKACDRMSLKCNALIELCRKEAAK